MTVSILSPVVKFKVRSHPRVLLHGKIRNSLLTRFHQLRAFSEIAIKLMILFPKSMIRHYFVPSKACLTIMVLVMVSAIQAAPSFDQRGKITRPTGLSAGGFGPVFAFQQGNLAVWQASGYGRIALFQVAQNAGLATSSYLATMESPDVAYDNPDFGHMLAFGPQSTLFAGSPHTWISAPHDGRIYQYDINSMGSPILVRKFAESPHTAGYFGSNLAVDGDILIAAQGANGGAPQTRSGAFIYRINADKSLTLLKTQDRSTDFMMPSGAAVSGDVCAIMFGYVSGNGTSAEAWVFRITRVNGLATGVEGPVSIPFSNTTVDATRAQPSGGSSYHAVALKDNRLALGIYGDDVSVSDNAVHLYNVSSSGALSATQEAVIPTPGVGASSRFGRRLLFMNRDALLVSDPLATRSGTTAKGKVHIYEPSSPGQWNVSRVIEATTTNPSEAFGEFLALDDTQTNSTTLLAVGARTNADDLSVDHDIYLFGVNDANADLSSLTLSSGTLSPSFNSTTTSYSVTMDNAADWITVTPTAAQANATIEVRVNDGTYANVPSSSASAALALNIGSNTVEVRVTAPNGISTKTYTFSVTRRMPLQNIVALQRSATPLVDITYDLAAVPPGKIILEISSDGGATWAVPVETVSGAIGSGVAPGLGRSIVWDAGTDFPESYSSQMRFRLTLDDGYALIPSGSFVMGATSGDSDANAPPVTVSVSDFYLQETETTKAQWDEVRAWGLNNGYTDLAVGGGKASYHPVQMVSWWDVVKWCNARSEKEGLTPCYTVAGDVMRTGTVAPTCNWSANGYRLPSEAEWEKAARGGVSGQRFPWGDTITHSEANYFSSTTYSYDVSPTRGYQPSYATGATPYTSQVGSFTANSYGLFDMIGNVEEWCWDWYGGSYYQNGSVDPQGPATGNNRVMRGGSHSTQANNARSSNRTTNPPGTPSSGAGLRPARSFMTASIISATTALASVDTRSTNFNPPVVVDPYAAPFNLPSSSSNGTPLTYAVVAGATIANVTGNTVTLTGENGPVTLRATGDGLEDQYLTFRVEYSPNWKKVFTGSGAPGNFTYGLKEDGSIWSWGANVSPNLGVAGLGFRRRPLQMGTDSDWADLSAGENGNCFAAIKTDGRLFTWGSNNAGQLGVGTTTNSFTPVLVDGSTDWKQAVVGSAHMIALKQDGSLWAWGNNSNGRLGDGTTVNQSIPIRIGAEVDWRFVAAGNAASYAIKNDGSLWAWGFNGSGRLGDGTTTDRLVPTRIGLATDWLTVDGGNTHAIALKTDGSLWTWGANASGQIGNGATTNQLIPVQLSPGQTWSKIYAGRDNSMAIRSNGTLWAWGSNTLGQLGDGTMSNQLYPVQVGYHHDWKEIACAVHSAGIREDGRMWSWGTDDDGELGNTSCWHNPIGGAATNVSSFSTGSSVTAFVRKDGSLWTLGTNSNLCLGLGLSSTSFQQWEPARIGTANNWVSVTAGENTFLP